MLATALVGCGARTEPLHYSPASAGMVADAGRDGGAAIAPASDASIAPDAPDASILQISAPVIVLDGVREGVDLQRFGQLVWTGDKFAVVWCENRRGHIFVAMRFVSSSGVVAAHKQVLSADYNDLSASPQSTWLTWTGTEFAVFWAIDERIVMRRVGADGGYVAAPVVAVDGLGRHIYLEGGVHRPGGHALAWVDDILSTHSYLPYFERVSDGGVPVGGKVALDGGFDGLHTAGGFVAQGDGYAMVWNQRGPALDRVYLSRFDAQGASLGASKEIYTADSALLSFTGPSVAAQPGSELVALWDMGRGVIVQRRQGEAEQEWAVIKGATSAPVIGVMDDGSAGLLYGRGKWKPTNPLSTEVTFALVDEHGVVAGPSVLNVGHGGCLEGYTIASTGDGFGLLWVKGCAGARTIYFSRVKVGAK
ncbi:MAG: hypothetical protein ACYC8T_22815 [Myxococcaceae bacterium]